MSSLHLLNIQNQTKFDRINLPPKMKVYFFLLFQEIFPFLWTANCMECVFHYSYSFSFKNMWNCIFLEVILHFHILFDVFYCLVSSKKVKIQRQYDYENLQYKYLSWKLFIGEGNTFFGGRILLNNRIWHC